MILHDPSMGSSGMAEAQAAAKSFGMEVQIFEAADPFARDGSHGRVRSPRPEAAHAGRRRLALHDPHGGDLQGRERSSNGISMT